MALVCLKCDERVGDEHYEPCPHCGAKEWVWVLEHPYVVTHQDYEYFLKRIGVPRE